MKNKILIFITITLFLIYNIFNKTESKAGLYRVAIILPVSHPSLEEIKKGFIDTVNKEIKVSFKTYNANGDRILLRSQIEDIVNNNFDLIFSIATSPCIITKEVTAARNKLIPIVCSAVSDPIGNKIINSMSSSGNNLTVVTEQPNFDEQIDNILYLKSDIKKVLLVYNSLSNSDLEKQKSLLESVLLKRGIKLTSVQVLHSNEISQKVPAFINDNDLVMVLKDNLVVSGIEGLVNICNRFKVPLYASDLNSVVKGATAGFGIIEYEDGVQAGKKAIAILQDKKLPSQIPSSFVGKYKFKVNQKAMDVQGLKVDSFTLKQIDAQVI